MAKQTPSSTLAKVFWENRSGAWLLLASVVLALMMLSSRSLWTEEGRWSAIIGEMLLRHDYLHPYIASSPYYDKPLFSYWLSVLFSYLTGGFNEWSLRLPSALAGIVTVYCTYRLGTIRFNQTTGLIAGWLLTTTVFFVFWERVAGVDILNLAGIMLATLWYFKHREQTNFLSYFIFFLIIAVTCLCKGLIGAAITGLAILPDLWSQFRWKKHLNWAFFFALGCGVFLYLLPFLASQYLDASHYQDNGLFKVYRENILRFFQPFDHKGAWYVYFYYLPVYLLPWIVFFIPALWNLLKRRGQLNPAEAWIGWVTLFIFLFLTMSGSRRSYYILPIVPFALLLTANWISQKDWSSFRQRNSALLVVITFVVLFIWLAVIQPNINRRDRGVWQFAATVQKQANEIHPWSQWQIVLYNHDVKPLFYLKPQQPAQLITLKEIFAPDFAKYHPNTIILAKESDMVILQPILANYQIIKEQDNQWLDKKEDAKLGVALIPKSVRKSIH